MTAAGETERRRGRPAAADVEHRRAALIDVAAAMFMTHGYEAASVDMIAAAARVSKATIYARFGGKAALFEAVALHSIAAMRGDLHDIPTKGRAPEAVLHDFALRIANEVADTDRLALLRLAIAGRDRFPDIARRLHDHIADTIAPLSRYLTDLKAAGACRLDDPAQMAAHFINMANGGLRFLLTDDFSDAGFRHDWSRQVVRLFLDGIGAGNRNS